MHRREFLRTAGGVTAAGAGAAAATPAAAQEDGDGGDGGDGGQQGPIDYGGWFEDVPYWEGDGSTVDATGQEEASVAVGAGAGLQFGPAAIHVDPGTTVVWEWTGNGGGHNVVAQDVPDGVESFSSGSAVSAEGTTFEFTFETEGIHTYYCNPHLGRGMKGAVAVGEVPRKAVSSGPPTRTEPDPNEMGVPIRAHYVGIATILMIVSSFVFTFFLLKYGESPNVEGGNN